jgi:hypothetical protein
MIDLGTAEEQIALKAPMQVVTKSRAGVTKEINYVEVLGGRVG